MSKIIRTQMKGFVALTAVILVSAVLLLVVTSLSLQMIDESEISSASEQSAQAQTLANGCAEYALLKLSNNPGYTTTSETITLPNGSCTIEDITTNGSNTTIQIRSMVGDKEYTAEVEITVSTTTPSVVIDEWNEYADF